MSNKAVRIIYNIHRRLGIFVSIHFILLALTGSILLFKEEITGQDHHHEVAHELPENLQSLLDQAKVLAPTSRPLTLTYKDEHTIELRLGIDGSKKYRQSHRLYFDSETLQPKEYKSLENTWIDFILRIHREFLLGSNGKLYVGLIGILYTFMLISGFLIYGPFHKKLGFAEIRRATPRTIYSDLHKYLGMVTMGWALIIGVTGTLLGFSSTLIKIFQYQELKSINQMYTQSPSENWASLDLILKNSQEKLPEGSFDFLAFPDTEFSPTGHFLVLLHGEGLKERLVDIAVVDSVTGSVDSVRELPWYLKLAALSEPLHFGNYGGLPLKLIWLVMTLGTLALPILGLLLALRKKKQVKFNLPSQFLIKCKGSQSFSQKIPWLLIATSWVSIVGCFLVANFSKYLLLSLMLLPVILVLAVVRFKKK